MKNQHYYLVSAKILFMDVSEGEDQATHGQMGINTVLRLDEQKVCTRHLALAQQQAQLLFVQKLGSPDNITIMDVFLINLAYLGHMTEEEFAAAPEGTVMEEVQIPSALQ